MKPKHLAIGLVVVGVLVAGVLLLLVPENDQATPGGAQTAQDDGPDGLPKFRADLGEARPAEPLDVPASEAGTEPRPSATGPGRDPNLHMLSGQVVRASDGSALPGALVLVGWSASFDEVNALGTTDQAGHFEVNVSTTETQLSIVSAGAWPQRSQSYPIEPGTEDVAGLDFVFDSGFSITGLVLDEAGRPLAGANVDVSSVVEERGDETGHFVFRDVAPAAGVGSVRVSAKAPGHVSASVDAVVPRDSSQPVTVELRLPPGGAIAGRVTDSRGAPLANVQAAIVYVMTSQHGEQAPGGLSAKSNAEGDYRIDSVPAGRYLVEVGYGAGLARSGGEVPEGFAVEIDLRNLIPNGAGPDSDLSMGARIAKQLTAAKGLALRWFPDVEVEIGKTTRLDVALFPPGSLAGRVLDATGSPVEDAHVTLERIERWPAPDISGSTITSTTGLVITSRGEGNGKGQTELAEVESQLRTDAHGAFELTGLMDGEKRLSAKAAGLVSQERALVLQLGETRTGVDFVLVRGLSVRGRVRDVLGAPIEGANVTISAIGAENVSGDGHTTDAEGRFEIGGLAVGPQKLLVFKSGFASLWKPVEPGGAELELTMTAAPKVIGIVTHAVSGKPITNLDISVAYEGSIWTNTGGTYPEGRFEMPIDSDTLCTVTVRSGGFREVVLKNVLPSRTAVEPLQIRLQPE